jgi:hypothetical protein
MIIKKKCWPQYFQEIVEGKKNYELRLNDFTINAGDILILEEYNTETKEYTGRTLEKKVLGVNQFQIDKLFWPEAEIKEKGLQIISLG